MYIFSGYHFILFFLGLTEYISTALDAITNDDVEKDEDHVLNDLKFPLKDKATGFKNFHCNLLLIKQQYDCLLVMGA